MLGMSRMAIYPIPTFNKEVGKTKSSVIVNYVELIYNAKEPFIWLLPIKNWGDFSTRPNFTLSAS